VKNLQLESRRHLGNRCAELCRIKENNKKNQEKTILNEYTTDLSIWIRMLDNAKKEQKEFSLQI